MVTLIFENARAARAEAERVRGDSLKLRYALRESTRLARTRTEKAAAAAAAAASRRRTMTSTSPWSDLEWRRHDDELGRVLVPLD